MEISTSQKNKYKCILVDPPWEFYNKKVFNSEGSEAKYGQLSLEQLKKIDLSDISDDNCFIFMWTTNIILPWTLELMKHWGFMYRSKLVWIKPQMGQGFYFRSASEDLLVGKKGKGIFKFKSQPSWFFGPRQDHSHKPEEIYDIIERVCDGPRLEMFARKKREGWDYHGNEIENGITINTKE